MLDSYARGLVACLLTALTSPLTLAQAIDLPEALDRTLAHSPELRARGFEVQAAEARLLQATLRPSPELNIELEDAFGTDQYRALHGAQTTVTLGWVLERGVREHIVAAARESTGITAAELAIARLDAVAETARRYIHCLLLQARYENAGTGVERAQEAVAAVRLRVEASRAQDAELARAEAELARAELRLDEYVHELRAAYHRLSAQWGMTEPDFATAAGRLAGMPPLEPFDALLARIEQNPDVTVFVSQSRLAEAELSLASARSRPNWKVSGGLRRIEQSDDWALVGNLSVPLRMGNRNQGRIAESSATLALLEAAEAAARIRIETELFVLYEELRHNIELAEGLETNVAPKYETALADMRRAFELGRSSYLEYRAVQTELLEVAYEVLDAHANAWLLAIEIERLTGESLSPVPIGE